MLTYVICGIIDYIHIDEYVDNIFHFKWIINRDIPELLLKRSVIFVYEYDT